MSKEEKEKKPKYRRTITIKEETDNIADDLAKHYQISVSGLIRMLIMREGRKILGLK